jgi:hypothetical protein
LEARKASNREADETRQADLDAQLDGPSWDRVSALLDSHEDMAGGAPDVRAEDDDEGKASSSSGSSRGRGRKAAAAPGPSPLAPKDATRMRDILISLKAHGGPAGKE